MSFRDELARIIATDPRYTIDAYVFILESLGHARQQKLKAKGRDRDKPLSTARVRRTRSSPTSKKAGESGHVSGRELCESVRRLGLRQFGLLAATVFGHWGLRSTSDIGDIVYHLIDAGDLEKTPSDSRSDFDNVFDFETALRPKPLLKNDVTTDTCGAFDLKPIDPSAKGEQA
jgi:uncharacterized repeat protein (TIGR04138 family)